jgi:hypothetical protein
MYDAAAEKRMRELRAEVHQKLVTQLPRIPTSEAKNYMRDAHVVNFYTAQESMLDFALPIAMELETTKRQLEAKTRECEAYIRTLKSISSMWTHDGSVGDHAISLYAARNMANYVLHNNETQ